jgi:hypothetical protein
MDRDALLAEYKTEYAKFEKFVNMNTGLSQKGAEKLMPKLIELENQLFPAK